MAQAPAPNPGQTPRPAPGAPAAQRHRRLFTQLACWFVVISLVPLCLAFYFNYYLADQGILADKQENLKALVLHQASEVVLFFDSAREMINLLSGSPVVRDSLQDLANITPADYADYGNSTALHQVQAEWSSRFSNFVSQMDYSDLYLVNLQGLVVYSAGAGAPLYANLQSAPGNQLALATLYTQVMQQRTIALSGMTLQTPNQKPAFYFGAPIFSQDGSSQLIGVLILALNQTRLQQVLDNRIGLGTTGEPIIFARDHGRFMVVNIPFFHPESAFTFTTPLRGAPSFGDGTTDAGAAKVAQGTGPYGHERLAAWTYLPTLDWVLMQKIDRDEVFAPVESLRRFSLGLGALTFILVIGVASLVARGITRPVVELTAVAERIAHGDLLTPVNRNERNEIGQLSQAICTMARSLKSLVRKVQDSSAIISTNAVQMAASSRQQAEVAHGTGAAAIEVAATARQISATSQELTRTMEEVNNVAQGTAQRAEAGLDGLQAIQVTMGELDQARGTVSAQLELIARKTESICGITVTMTKVADQTNLLSLNAAIEARKAGEYGRGFSVVAREIQRLADQAGVATLEIEHTIAEMRQSVDAGVAGMKGFSATAAAGVERIQTVTHQLTEVIQQVQGLPPRFEMVLQGMQSQSEGAQQITGAISQMSESAQQTATAVQEALRLLEQLRDTTRTLQAEVSLFKT